MVVFTEWLKSKGVYEEYMSTTAQSTINIISEQHSSFISGAFIWSNCPEIDWSTLSYEWVEITANDDVVFDTTKHIPKW